MSSFPKELKMRPYARLLTMLGDQLIKDERIALMELIKNAYDADADWVRVVFEGFDDKWRETSGTRIVIEDNGCGMTREVLENAWMNPATPHKKRSQSGERLTEQKKRVVQGEKGIGRFAMLKIGSKIRLITRPRKSKTEFVVTLDFSKYDEEFTVYNGRKHVPFLDELSCTLEERPVQVFDKREIIIDGVERSAGESGTRIEIECLKTKWNEDKINDISADAAKLQPIFSRLRKKSESVENQFTVSFLKDDFEISPQTREIEQLTDLLETRSVLSITEGSYDCEKKRFEFLLNGKEKIVREFDDLRVLKWCNKYFGKQSEEEKTYPSCGSFGFAFYVFDLRAEKESKYYLPKEDVKRIKDHRVYLYRDGIRVYPYGEPDDDWLQTDVLRGLSAASEFLSNDQIVGWIDITHEGNPGLKDKTSREGLVGDGSAPQDFIKTLQSFLGYVRQELFDKYRIDIQRRREQRAIEEKRVEKDIAALITHATENNDERILKLAHNLQRSSQLEKRVYERRIEITENLAAVGLAVETSSHDLRMMIDRTFDEFDKLTKRASRRGEQCTSCHDDLQKVSGMLSFVQRNIKGIQSLFQSAKQRPRPIVVADVLKKVVSIYDTIFAKKDVGIKVDIEAEGPPLTAKCTDAVLMQLFINLLDNSLYWLTNATAGHEGRRICIRLDGENNQLFYADNGPGIPLENQPYVFDAFFSTKETGRGLGLYIARQLLSRFDFSIEIVELKREKILAGANFIVDFNPKESI